MQYTMNVFQYYHCTDHIQEPAAGIAAVVEVVVVAVHTPHQQGTHTEERGPMTELFVEGSLLWGLEVACPPYLEAGP